MHPSDILAGLQKAGCPACTVAETLGVTRSAVSQVIHSDATSYNIASFIAAPLNNPLRRLWPDGRYDEPIPEREAAA